MRRMMRPIDLVRKGGLLHVALPARAERRYRDRERDVRSELKAAGFRKELIQANVRGLRRIVESLSRKAPGTWDRYAADFSHVGAQRDAKARFVSAHAAAHPARLVWDVGANDGHFSRLVADRAGYVLALDADDVVLDDLYGSLAAAGIRNVLPLVHDMANPSPALGWRNAERPPLSDRSTPDLVLCLAVIHHLVVARNIPLRAVVDWLRDLDARAILEFVPPDDPMVRGLTANKRPHEIHRDYDEPSLRRYLAERFVIEAEEVLPGGNRRLFALRPSG
jgi:SAM-dependent methyltransferase